MTSAEDANRVFSGVIDGDAENVDEEFEEHEQSPRKVIPTKSTSYLRVPETQRGEFCVTHHVDPSPWGEGR